MREPLPQRHSSTATATTGARSKTLLVGVMVVLASFVDQSVVAAPVPTATQASTEGNGSGSSRGGGGGRVTWVHAGYSHYKSTSDSEELEHSGGLAIGRLLSGGCSMDNPAPPLISAPSSPITSLEMGVGDTFASLLQVDAPPTAPTSGDAQVTSTPAAPSAGKAPAVSMTVSPTVSPTGPQLRKKEHDGTDYQRANLWNERSRYQNWDNGVGMNNKNSKVDTFPTTEADKTSEYKGPPMARTGPDPRHLCDAAFELTKPWQDKFGRWHRGSRHREPHEEDDWGTLYHGWRPEWDDPPFLQGAALVLYKLINSLRMDPQGWVPLVEAYRQNQYKGKQHLRPDLPPKETYEGKNALGDAIVDLRDLDPLPRLRPSYGMSKAAEEHGRDKAQSGLYGKEGTGDHSTSHQRLLHYGRPDCEDVEVMAFGMESPCAVIMEILADDGDHNRFRRDMLLHPQFREIGVAHGPHSGEQWITVIELAGEYKEQVPEYEYEDPEQIEYLCPLEEDIYSIIREVRRDPEDFAKYLQWRKRYYRREGNTWHFQRPGGRDHVLQQGWSAVQSTINMLDEISQKAPLPELTISRGMSLAAKAHARDIGPRGYRDCVGSDHSFPIDRLKREGMPSSLEAYQQSKGADREVVRLGGYTALDMVLAALIDDDLPSRKNRDLLLDPYMRVIGIGTGTHKREPRTLVMDLTDAYLEKDGQYQGLKFSPLKPKVRMLSASMSEHVDCHGGEELIYTPRGRGTSGCNGKQCKDEFLCAINELRNVHGVPPLLWNDELEQYAQQMAAFAKGQSCQSGHRSDLFERNRGETLAMGKMAGGVPMTPDKVTRLWYYECCGWDYDQNECMKGTCSSFEQLVWKDSQFVGCAMTTCGSEGEFWVCNFEPGVRFAPEDKWANVLVPRTSTACKLLQQEYGANWDACPAKKTDTDNGPAHRSEMPSHGWVATPQGGVVGSRP